VAQEGLAPPTWALGTLVVATVVFLWAAYRAAYGRQGGLSRTEATGKTRRGEGKPAPSGSVYVLTNPAYPDLVKVGATTRGAQRRAEELSARTGVPEEFQVEHEVEVSAPKAVEKTVHRALAGRRINPDREFFRISPSEAREAIQRAAETEPTSVAGLFSTESPLLERATGLGLVAFSALLGAGILAWRPGGLPPAAAVDGTGIRWVAERVSSAAVEVMGYLSLLPVGFVGLWGWALLRGRRLGPLVGPTVSGLALALGLAAGAGWLGLVLADGPVGWASGQEFASAFYPWAGASGRGLARRLQEALGPTGTGLVLGVWLAGALIFALTSSSWRSALNPFERES